MAYLLHPAAKRHKLYSMEGLALASCLRLEERMVSSMTERSAEDWDNIGQKAKRIVDLQQSLNEARGLLREVADAHKLPEGSGSTHACMMTVGLWRRVKEEGDRG